MTTQQDIETVQKALMKLLTLADGDAKSRDAVQTAWFKEHAIPLTNAAIGLIGGAFLNLERIANSLEATDE